MKTVLLTAIFGDYDSLKPLPAENNFDDAVCITDQAGLESSGWRIIEQAVADNPRLAAKHPKMQPFDFVDADIAVWLDGSAEITDPGFRSFCEDALADNDFVVWQHPEDRDCLFREGVYCMDWPKYRNTSIREQLTYYREAGMPEHFGLWACGTIVWRNTDAAKQFGLNWLQENRNWSIQDQISFPYLVWKTQPRFTVFPAHELQNEFLRWHQHRRND